MPTFMYRLPTWLMGGAECELVGSDEDYEYITVPDPDETRFELRVPAGTVIKTKLVPDEPPSGLYYSKAHNLVLVNDRGHWSQHGWSNQKADWETAFDHWCNGEMPTRLVEVPMAKAPWVSPQGAYPTSITVDLSTGMIHVTVAGRLHAVNPMKALNFGLALVAIASQVIADEVQGR